jgi:hypothetical protein
MTRTKLPTVFKKQLKKCFNCNRKGIASVYDYDIQDYKTVCKFCDIIHLSASMNLKANFRIAER